MISKEVDIKYGRRENQETIKKVRTFFKTYRDRMGNLEKNV